MISNKNSLMQALYNDDMDTVRTELANGADVNKPYNAAGWTPFMWACKEYCDPDIIELFLNYGGNPNIINNSGETSLYVMAKHRGSFTCPDILIKAGANPNTTDINGNTPLMAVLSHPQISLRIAVAGNLLPITNLTVKNNKGQTAYDIAKANPNFEDRRFLEQLKKGLNND